MDGQQRITSIWATFKGATIDGKNYSEICLDLDAGAKYENADWETRRQIKVFKEIEPDNDACISLRDVLTEKRLLTTKFGIG